MAETRNTRLFNTGSGQTVLLPAEFQFDGEEVYVTRDGITGDVVLSERLGANSRRDFFEMMRSIDVPDEFMADRPMNRLPLR
jgi:antitoxin VapB